MSKLHGPIAWTKQMRWTRYGLHILHGKDGSSIIRKVDVSWRTVSGIMINTKWGVLWLYFRNWGY